MSRIILKMLLHKTSHRPPTFKTAKPHGPHEPHKLKTAQHITEPKQTNGITFKTACAYGICNLKRQIARKIAHGKKHFLNSCQILHGPHRHARFIKLRIVSAKMRLTHLNYYIRLHVCSL